MKNLTLTLTLLFSCFLASLPVSAQRPDSRDREAWMKEMQQFKSDYIAKRLDLSEDQKPKFVDLYNKMDNEVRAAQEEAEMLYRQTYQKKDAASDLECEKAAEAIYELKGRENVIEMKYFNEYKAILTPRQLFKLKEAERDFTRELMKQHRRQKAK